MSCSPPLSEDDYLSRCINCVESITCPTYIAQLWKQLGPETRMYRASGRSAGQVLGRMIHFCSLFVALRTDHFQLKDFSPVFQMHPQPIRNITFVNSNDTTFILFVEPKSNHLSMNLLKCPTVHYLRCKMGKKSSSL